jgi:aprataxin
MKHLHCHVISQDFNSNYLKSKKHFNSFTTPFFISLGKVINDLSTSGAIKGHPTEEMLKEQMKCHHVGCRTSLRIMPLVREHTQSCQAPQPNDKELESTAIE